MHIITIGAESTASGKVSIPNGNQAIFHVARALIDAGHDPQEQVEVYREDRKIFNACSLDWWAKRSVSEGDQSARFTKYRPFPTGVWGENGEASQ